MVAARRSEFNFGLQRAVIASEQFNRPLIIFEPLRSGYRWANDRLHWFIMQGMADNFRAFTETSALYFPWLERKPGESRGLLEALASEACVVITDDFPAFFLPNMFSAAAKSVPVRMEAVDSNGLLPMRQAPKTFSRAVDFRRYLQKELPTWLTEDCFSEENSLSTRDIPRLDELPAKVLRHWKPISLDELEDKTVLSGIDIDHSVSLSPFDGGLNEARKRWNIFSKKGLRLYAEGRNHPDEDLSSGLSPWLHFGHIGVHEIFLKLISEIDWSPEVLGKASGKREGWWGMDAHRESFLDELITWREIGFNMCARESNHYEYDSLPEWARVTLDEHRTDPRPYIYSLETFEAAQTHDELWNAAQRQLVEEGRIHSYLRMLWGKKILHWSESPEAALRIMIELNNRYALDGRDPNSYSGIFWVLGRYDRAWGPEREIFGKIRYMTSDSTMRKLRVNRYLGRWSG